MRLLTAAAHAATALDRYNKQYSHRYSTDWRLADGRKPKSIADELAALPVPVDPAEVERVIGNDGWSYPQCDMCEERVDAVAQFERSGESHLSICKRCVAVADRLLKSPELAGTSIFDNEWTPEEILAREG